MSMPEMPKWYSDDGSIVSCTEKIKVMTENMSELFELAQDAFEDGLLLEVSEVQMRETLHQLINQLVNPYLKPKAALEKSYTN